MGMTPSRIPSRVTTDRLQSYLQSFKPTQMDLVPKHTGGLGTQTETIFREEKNRLFCGNVQGKDNNYEKP